MKSVARLLRESVALLKEKGWTQGKFHDHMNDTFCAVGALEKVMDSTYGENWGGNSEAIYKYREARNALDTQAELNGYHDIITLNDAKTTTFEKVRSMFTAAIQAAKQA